jgi:hypothetical protein
METSGKNDRKLVSRSKLITFVTTVVAVMAILQVSSGQAQITGTVSQSEPPGKQDGTPAHPFSNASQCPTRTDLVFWPSGRSVPTIPPSISVCFVGNEPFENSGPDRIEVREHK